MRFLLLTKFLQTLSAVIVCFTFTKGVHTNNAIWVINNKHYCLQNQQERFYKHLHLQTIRVAKIIPHRRKMPVLDILKGTRLIANIISDFFCIAHLNIKIVITSHQKNVLFTAERPYLLLYLPSCASTTHLHTKFG